MGDENLKERFPLAKRSILQQFTPWFLAAFVIDLLIYFIEPLFENEAISQILAVIFFLVIIGSGLRLLYLITYYLRYGYRIVGDELLISRGVIFKLPLGIPLGKISVIQIKRTPFDILWGLATVEIIVPGVLEQDLMKISGFSNKTAIAFKAYVFERN